MTKPIVNPEIIENSLVKLQKLNNDIKNISSQILEIQDDNESQNVHLKIKKLDSQAKIYFSDYRELISKLENNDLDENFIDRFSLAKENFTTTKVSYNGHLARAVNSVKNTSRNELFSGDLTSSSSKNSAQTLRNRNKSKNKSAAEINSNLAHLNQAMESTVSGSAAMLEQLNEQTDKVKGSANEVKSQKALIEDGQKLLKKYKQREFTDKILIYLGLMTYCLTIVYIVLKRIFGFFL